MGHQSNIPHSPTPGWLIRTPFARKISLVTEIHLRDCLYSLDQLTVELQGCLRPTTTIEIAEIDVDLFEFELTEFFRVTHVKATGSLQTDKSKDVTHIEGLVKVGTDKLVYLTILTAVFIWGTISSLGTINQTANQLCFWHILGTIVFIGFWVESVYRLHRIDKVLKYTFTRRISDGIMPGKK